MQHMLRKRLRVRRAAQGRGKRYSLQALRGVEILRGAGKIHQTGV